MVSFQNKPTGSVCISPIRWLSNSLQQNPSLFSPLLQLLPSFQTYRLLSSASSLPPPLVASLSQYVLCFTLRHFTRVYDSLSAGVSLYGVRPDSPSFPVTQTLSLYLLQV